MPGDAAQLLRRSKMVCSRDLERAENTAISCSLKYCPDAILKGDWETLAKIYNGGPIMSKTVYNWSKVSNHLHQHEASEVHAVNAKIGALLQPSKKLSGVKVSSKADVIKKMTQLDRKWGLAAVESDKRAIPLKTYQASKLYRKRKPQRSVKVRLRNVAVSHRISPRCSNNTKLSALIVERVQTRCLIADVSSKHPSLQSLLHFGYWTFPQSAKLHQAALRLQTFWRMHVARLNYQRLRSVALLLQKWWRKYQSHKVQGTISLSRNICSENGQGGLDESYLGVHALQRTYMPPDLMTAKCSRLPEKSGDTAKSFFAMPTSPVDYLYDVNISEKWKDQILTELATSFFVSPEANTLNRDTSIDNGMDLLCTTGVENAPAVTNINSAFSLANSVAFSFPQEPDEGLEVKSPTALSSPFWVWNQTVVENGRKLPSTVESEPSSADLCNAPTERVKRLPSLTFKQSYLEESPLSPTREWISTPAGSCKSSPSWKIRVPVEVKLDNVPQSGRWFQDLGRVDIPSSWWDSTEIKSMPTDGVWIQDSSHNSKNSLDATGSLECSPMSAGLIVKRSASLDLHHQIDDASASLNIGVHAVTPLVTHCRGSDSPLSPAMEEELLEELAKLLVTGADAVSSSGTSNFQASAPSLTGTLEPGSCFKARVQSKVNSANSARKLDFPVGNGDGLQESAGCAGDMLNTSSKVGHMTSAQESEQQVSADDARCSVTEPSLPMSQPGPDCELFQRNNLFQSDAGMNMLKDCPWPLRDGNQSTGYLQSTLQSPFDGISGGFLPFSEASSDSSPWTPNKPWGPSYQGPAATQGELDTVYGRVQVETTDQHNGGSRDLVADIQAGTALVSSLSRWQQMPDTYTEDPQSILSKSLVCLQSDQFDGIIDSKPDCTSCIDGEEEPQNSSHERMSSAETVRDDEQTPCVSKEDIPSSCSVVDDNRSMSGNVCPSPSSPDFQCSVETSKASSSGAVYEQEISSAQSMSVSRKYFLQSQVTPSHDSCMGGCDSDSESTVSTANVQSATTDYLLETLDKRTPTEGSYQQSLFTCEDSPLCKPDKSDAADSPDCGQKTAIWVQTNFDTLEKHINKQCPLSESFSGPLPMTPRSQDETTLRRAASSSCTWACGLRGTSGHCLPSLHDLCKLWDEQSVDLLTRSLKYKQLITDPNLLSHEVRLAYDVPPLHGAPTIAWEIQSIERLLERLENREMLKELVKQQRDIIYTNIATHASRRERYQMYNKWGIRKLSTGRLRKVVYGMLWKDPKRYNESADLVMQYL
ncbi:unnamed protein product [Sphagnum tenellum]